MRLEWIGCRFRIEVALFPSRLKIRRYRVAPAAEMLAAQREIMRQLNRKLKNPVSTLVEASTK